MVSNNGDCDCTPPSTVETLSSQNPHIVDSKKCDNISTFVPKRPGGGWFYFGLNERTCPRIVFFSLYSCAVKKTVDGGLPTVVIVAVNQKISSQ